MAGSEDHLRLPLTAPMKQLLKKLLFPGPPTFRRIGFGLGRGIIMRLNLQNQMQRFLGLDERELAGHFRRGLAFARSAVDVGANDGYYTLIFLQSPVTRVVACEPGEVVEQLKENAAVNGHAVGPRLQVERRLIGGQPGQISLRELIDDLPKPVLIKMDIDGGEVDALASAAGLTGLKDTFWIVETHSIALERECLQWFAARGMKATIVDAAWWRIFIPELRPTEQNRWLIAEAPRSATLHD